MVSLLEIFFKEHKKFFELYVFLKNLENLKIVFQTIKSKMSVPEKMPFTYEQIVNHKTLTTYALRKDFSNLMKYDGATNSRGFAGNKILYHYQLANLLKCRRGTDMTLEEIFSKPDFKEKLWKDTIKRKRRKNAIYPNESDVFECFRANKGAVVFFKPITAKYLYTQFNATKVLDFTMGWGGRMLGAYASPQVKKYIGIDTNTNLQKAYEGLKEVASHSGYTEVDLIWKSCLDVDYSKLDYNYVLTSPPYVNLEVYEGMTPFEDDIQFYTKFLFPTLKKVKANINEGGWICLNISPKMYKDMRILFEFPNEDDFLGPPNHMIDLKQQMGSAKKSQDMIYCWKC